MNVKYSVKEKLTPELWRMYRDTYFLFSRNTHLPRNGFIITAWNPWGMRKTGAFNEVAHRNLLKQTTGKTQELVWGADIRLNYRELSIVFFGNLPQARIIGRRFKQLAFYQIRNGVIYLVATEGKRMEAIAPVRGRERHTARLPLRNYALR